MPPLRSVPSLGPGAAPVGRADGGSSQGPQSSSSDFTLAEASSFPSNACLSHILLWKHRAEKGRGFQSRARRHRNPVMGLVVQSPGGPLPAGHHTGLEESASPEGAPDAEGRRGSRARDQGQGSGVSGSSAPVGPGEVRWECPLPPDLDRCEEMMNFDYFGPCLM